MIIRIIDRTLEIYTAPSPTNPEHQQKATKRQLRHHGQQTKDSAHQYDRIPNVHQGDHGVNRTNNKEANQQKTDQRDRIREEEGPVFFFRIVQVTSGFLVLF